MTLYSEIAERIKKQVKLGILKPGEMLPNEIEFAEKLSVTRNTLRRTLQVLEKENLITRRKKAGTYIVENVMDILKTNLNIAVASNFGAMEDENLFFQRIDDEKNFTETIIAMRKLLADNVVLQMFSTSGKNTELPGVDGYLLVSPFSSLPFLKTLADRKIPHICFETHIQHPGVNTVMGDDEGAAYLCTRKLIEKGHRKIAFVGGLLKEPGQNTGFRRRTEGYRRAFREKGLEIDETLIFNDARTTDYESFDTQSITSAFMKNIRRVSAAICAVAPSAVLLREVPAQYNIPVLCVDKKFHLHSPAQEKLINNFPGCVKPREKIAEAGIRKLFEWITNPDFKPGCFKIDFENNFQTTGFK